MATPPTAPRRRRKRPAAAVIATPTTEGGDDGEPPTKKARTSRPVYVPVARTLEPDVHFAEGAVQMPPDLGALAVERGVAAAADAHVLPTRSEQNSATLLPAAGAAPILALRHGADVDAWPTHGHAVADVFRSMYAPVLKRAAARPLRMGDAASGVVLAPMTRHAETSAEREQRYLLFYASDPEPDADRPFGLAPADYPMLQAMLAELTPVHMQRRDDARDAAELLPRASVETVTMAYLADFRLPPTVGAAARDRRRPCRRGTRCMCMALAASEGRPEVGYTAAEFKTPSALRAWRERRARGLPVNDANDGPAGACLECLLYAWTMRVHYALKYKHTASQPCNTVTMLCGPGEYARDVMLRTEVDGQPTGIAGHVPAYSAARRQYVPLDDSGSGVLVVREINVDFRSSLSQSNVCLGCRKLRPLAGMCTDGTATLAVPRALLGVARLPIPVTTGTDWPALWQRFVDAHPAEVLADRVLARTGATESRVPAAWLRRMVLLSFSTPITTDALWWARVPPDARRALASLSLPALADLALDVFEGTVVALATQPAARALATRLLDMAFAPGPGAAWRAPMDAALRDVPRPRGSSSSSSTHVMDAALVRIVGALLFAHVVRPWPAAADTTRGAEFRAMAQLLVDTHLDMLARAWQADDDADDRGWLAAPAQALAACYPHALRVVCRDELPDVTIPMSATNPYYVSGRKSPQVFILTLIHVLSKLLNEECQRHRFDSILGTAMEYHPTLARLVALILECVLLGALPGAQCVPLSLWTRVRIRATFAHMTTARLCAWTTQHPILVMALLREYYLSVLEADGVQYAVRGTTTRWHSFVLMARHTVGDVRRALPAGRPRHGRDDWPWARFDDPNTGLDAWHDRGKVYNVKIRKGTELDIMLKKITTVLNTLLLDRVALYDWMHAEGRLRALHVMAWDAARRLHRPYADADEPERRVLDTRWLKGLGMTRASYVRLRQWIHEYYDYNIKDNGFKHLFEDMCQTAHTDGFLLTTYLLLVRYYLDATVVTCASLEQTREQWRALRVDLGLEPWDETPAALGLGYLCEGCLRWANLSSSRGGGASGGGGDADADNKDNNNASGTDSMDVVDDDEEEEEEEKSAHGTPKKEAGTSGGDGPAVPTPPGLSTGRANACEEAYYNPVDGQLYCRRAWLKWPPPLPPPAGAGPAERSEAEELARQRPAKKLIYPLLGEFSCNAPLVPITMVGVFRVLRRVLYSRCVYCGQLCAATSVNMTNMGLSCGAHAVPCAREYPDDHALWERLQRPALAPACSPVAAACGACRRPSVVTLAVYDPLLRVRSVALCRYCCYELRALLPGDELFTAAQPLRPPISALSIVHRLQGRTLFV